MMGVERGVPFPASDLPNPPGTGRVVVMQPSVKCFRIIWLLGILEVVVACVIGGCETLPERPLASHRVSPTVLWSRAQNGLSLGIEQPQLPVVFEPTKNWTGPLVLVTVNPSEVEMKSNPAGVWTDNAVFNVYLRNDSKRPIFWRHECMLIEANCTRWHCRNLSQNIEREKPLN